jgi:uncharacterized protein (DUF58 family)
VLRPTRHGTAVLLACPLLALVAWLLGQPELAVIGAAGLVALGAAAVRLAARPPVLDVRRTAHPPRVGRGDPCRIVLQVRNTSTRRSPVVTLRDDVGRFGSTSLELAPVPGGATREAVYAFPTEIRGIHPVGPLSATAADPFGLVRRTRVLGGAGTVVVRPQVHPLVPLPPTPGEEPEAGVRSLTTSSTVDEEFASLRPYGPGDDIRRIHWRSTARTGVPVVRQFDRPWQHRTVVLLDVRRSAHPDPDAFERAVSAAASVVALAADQGELVRLVTTGGVDSGMVAATSHLEDLLDALAGTTVDARGSLTGTLAHLARSASGRLVSCTGTIGGDEHTALSSGGRRFGLHVHVACGPTGPPPADDTVVVRWDGTAGTGDLAIAWAAAVSAPVGAAR